MEIVTKKILITGLRKLGLDLGHQVLVHSSLSSLGTVEGGADTVIDSLLEVVGPNGTVLVPTLTGNSTLSAANPPIYDPQHTACRTGLIPETFRKRQEAIRSLHPTHSVAAIGAQAVELTKEHFFSITPCDEVSPYGKLTQQPYSYILLIGVDHQRSTMFHYVEELAGVAYHIQEGFVKVKLIVEGRDIYKHTMLHKYGTPRNFNVMEPVFEELAIQTQVTIGEAVVKLVRVQDMVRTTFAALRADRGILCKTIS